MIAQRAAASLAYGTIFALVVWALTSIVGVREDGMIHGHMTEYILAVGWFTALGHFTGMGAYDD